MNIQKKLKKAYKKSLKKINKTFFKSANAGLTLFILHLQYLRDNAIIKYETESSANLMTALAEYEASISDIEAGAKEFHWNNFCEFLKLEGQKWLML